MIATTQESKFTHVGIEKATQRKIALLVAVRGGNIYKMVGDWADKALLQAEKDGLVTKKMIQEITKNNKAAAQ